jgi:hypothetical protein
MASAAMIPATRRAAIAQGIGRPPEKQKAAGQEDRRLSEFASVAKTHQKRLRLLVCLQNNARSRKLRRLASGCGDREDVRGENAAHP